MPYRLGDTPISSAADRILRTGQQGAFWAGVAAFATWTIGRFSRKGRVVGTRRVNTDLWRGGILLRGTCQEKRLSALGNLCTSRFAAGWTLPRRGDPCGRPCRPSHRRTSHEHGRPQGSPLRELGLVQRFLREGRMPSLRSPSGSADGLEGGLQDSAEARVKLHRDDAEEFCLLLDVECREWVFCHPALGEGELDGIVPRGEGD